VFPDDGAVRLEAGSSCCAVNTVALIIPSASVGSNCKARNAEHAAHTRHVWPPNYAETWPRLPEIKKQNLSSVESVMALNKGMRSHGYRHVSITQHNGTADPIIPR